MGGMDLSPLRPVPPDRAASLLALVPDTPPAVMARGALLAGGGVAWAAGAEAPTAVVVQIPTPYGAVRFRFGAGDPEGLPPPRAFAAFTDPAGAVPSFTALPPGGVRRLRPNDARHLAALPPWLWGVWETPEALLRAAVAYARYLRGELVSLVCVTATTERYDAIGAYTIARARRNGFARECARRLIGAITAERGKRPVLLTAADDAAGVALAHSLGLTTQAAIAGYVVAER